MKNSMIDILNIMKNELTEIQNVLTREEWSELYDQLFSLSDIFKSETDDNKIEIVTDEMIAIISQNSFLKNLSIP